MVSGGVFVFLLSLAFEGVVPPGLVSWVSLCLFLRFSLRGGWGGPVGGGLGGGVSFGVGVGLVVLWLWGLGGQRVS